VLVLALLVLNSGPVAHAVSNNGSRRKRLVSIRFIVMSAEFQFSYCKLTVYGQTVIDDIRKVGNEIDLEKAYPESQ